MSRSASDWAWEQDGLDGGAKLVLLCLADHLNNETGRCDPSLTRIMLRCGTRKKDTVIARLRVLEAQGLILADRAAGRGNCYRLLTAAEPVQPTQLVPLAGLLSAPDQFSQRSQSSQRDRFRQKDRTSPASGTVPVPETGPEPGKKQERTDSSSAPARTAGDGKIVSLFGDAIPPPAPSSSEPDPDAPLWEALAAWNASAHADAPQVQTIGSAKRRKATAALMARTGSIETARRLFAWIADQPGLTGQGRNSDFVAFYDWVIRPDVLTRLAEQARIEVADAEDASSPPKPKRRPGPVHRKDRA